MELIHILLYFWDIEKGQMSKIGYDSSVDLSRNTILRSHVCVFCFLYFLLKFHLNSFNKFNSFEQPISPNSFSLKIPSTPPQSISHSQISPCRLRRMMRPSSTLSLLFVRFPSTKSLLEPHPAAASAVSGFNPTRSGPAAFVLCPVRTDVRSDWKIPTPANSLLLALLIRVSGKAPSRPFLTLLDTSF